MPVHKRPTVPATTVPNTANKRGDNNRKPIKTVATKNATRRTMPIRVSGVAGGLEIPGCKSILTCVSGEIRSQIAGSTIRPNL